ncbi:MAG: Chromate transport protein ChrA, partial [uncultured Thermomicrobiales bacterium]
AAAGRDGLWRSGRPHRHAATGGGRPAPVAGAAALPRPARDHQPDPGTKLDRTRDARRSRSRRSTWPGGRGRLLYRAGGGDHPRLRGGLRSVRDDHRRRVAALRREAGHHRGGRAGGARSRARRRQQPLAGGTLRGGHRALPGRDERDPAAGVRCSRRWDSRPRPAGEGAEGDGAGWPRRRRRRAHGPAAAARPPRGDGGGRRRDGRVRGGAPVLHVPQDRERALRVGVRAPGVPAQRLRGALRLAERAPAPRRGRGRPVHPGTGLLDGHVRRLPGRGRPRGGAGDGGHLPPRIPLRRRHPPPAAAPPALAGRRCPSRRREPGRRRADGGGRVGVGSDSRRRRANGVPGRRSGGAADPERAQLGVARPRRQRRGGRDPGRWPRL